MSSSNNSSSSGIGVFGVVGVVFIVLKLIGVISWSWWWVLAPFWIGFALWLLFAVIIAAVVAYLDRH